MYSLSQWFSGFRFKILTLVLIPSIFITLLITLSIFVTKQVSKSAAQVTDIRVPSLQGLQIMEEGSNSIRHIFSDAFASSNKIDMGDLRSKISGGMARYKEGYAIYAPLEQTKDEATEWEQYVPLARDWESKVNQLVSLISDSNLQGAKDFFEADLKKSFAATHIPFQRILGINYEVVVHEKNNFSQVNNNSFWMSLIFGFIGITGTLILGLYIGNKIAQELSMITETISNSSMQVFQASNSLSQSSESLAAASQEQASTIEETSTSLSMIVSIVKYNSAIAGQSNTIATEMQKLSRETTQYMENLSQAMNEILESNNRIEKLVKIIEEIGGKTEVIDDIVFKTQLLSFNASVEAERAGDQGRGFAVVAQEVGNLAQMSGQAASEISSIVKNSIKEAETVSQENKEKVEKGSQLALDTKEKMAQFYKMIGEILKSTDDITKASNEQTQGINEINLAVENLSKATQETARNAEESSSASTELSGQSNALKSLVEKLRFIITGSQVSYEDFNNSPNYHQNHNDLRGSSNSSSWKPSYASSQDQKSKRAS